jgi:hypothetical protein
MNEEHGTDRDDHARQERGGVGDAANVVAAARPLPGGDSPSRSSAEGELAELSASDCAPRSLPNVERHSAGR